MLRALVEMAAHRMDLAAQKETARRINWIGNCKPVLVTVDYIETAEFYGPIVFYQLNVVLLESEHRIYFEFWNAEKLRRFHLHIPQHSLFMVAELVDDLRFWEYLSNAAQEPSDRFDLAGKITFPGIVLPERYRKEIRNVAIEQDSVGVEVLPVFKRTDRGLLVVVRNMNVREDQRPERSGK